MAAVMLLILMTFYIILGVFAFAKMRRGVQYRLLYLPLFIAVMFEVFWKIPGNLAYLFFYYSGDVAPEQISRAATGTGIDAIYILLWLGAFLWMSRKPRQSVYDTSHMYENDAPQTPLFPGVDTDMYRRRLTLILWVCLGCLILFYPLARLLNWPLEAYAFQPGVGTEASRVRFYVAYAAIRKIISFGPLIAGLCIMLRGLKPFHRKNLVPIVVIAATCLYGLSMGSRSRLVGALIILVITAFVMRKQTGKIVGISLSALVVILVLSPMITRVRSSTAQRERRGMWERLGALVSVEESGAQTATPKELLKFNTAYYTGIVVEQTQNRGYVGVKPYLGLPFLLVPRFVWPSKPVLGSIDGTAQGDLYFKVGNWMYGGWDTSVWLSSGAHPYWAGGIAGVIVISILGGLFIGWVWCRSGMRFSPLGVLVMFLSVSALMGPHYDISLVIRQVALSFLLILVLYLPTKLFIRPSGQIWQSGARFDVEVGQ